MAKRELPLPSLAVSDARLTRRERVYAFICEYKREHDGNSPTVREIATAVGLATTSAVFYHLDALERARRITVAFRDSRSIEVMGGQWVPPGEAQ